MEGEQALCRCVTMTIYSDQRQGWYWASLRLRIKTPGFELHRDSRKGKEHLDGCSAVRQSVVKGVDESKDSISEILATSTCKAGLSAFSSTISSHLISSL